MVANLTVKGYRNMLGYTQEEFGKKLGISKQAYCNKELGKVNFNDKEKQKIKELVSVKEPGITIDELFFLHKKF